MDIKELDRPCKKIEVQAGEVRCMKKRLQQHGISINQDYLVSAEIDYIQKEFIRDWSTALLAMNDRVLTEVLSFVKEHDMKIPKEVTLVGIVDVSFTEFYYSALTVVGQIA